MKCNANNCNTTAHKGGDFVPRLAMIRFRALLHHRVPARDQRNEGTGMPCAYFCFIKPFGISSLPF